MKTEEKLSQEHDSPAKGMVLRPVGYIKNEIKKPLLAAGEDGISMQGETETARADMRKMRKRPSEIIINKDLIEVLDGIEGYSHLMVLYWAHRVPEQGRSLTKVHPTGRKEFPLVGIFSTCSPARPNPVLMTVVRLTRRKGNVLEVTGLDAVDGSPVVDIKPYVKNFYPQEEVLTPEWMQQIQREVARENLEK